ncbi:MAG TPA: four helix bundle protein [Opitutaceae bacterium]|nr:four helix bundle protein [Opitutaceae bacterium]
MVSNPRTPSPGHFDQRKALKKPRGLSKGIRTNYQIDSVGANIAEGYGRASPVDNQRFVRIARGSLYEVRHFLRRADKRGLLVKGQKQPLQTVLSGLLPALNAYLRSLGKDES